MYVNNEGTSSPLHYGGNDPQIQKRMEQLHMETLIRTYQSNNFGEDGATVVEMRTAHAGMDFVIKQGNRCSVSMAMGTGKGMTYITKAFIEIYQPETLVNQVSNRIEMRAMYTAGLEIPRRPKLNLKKTMAEFNERRSVMVSMEPKKVGATC
jgi:hypothetical protein